MYLNMPVFILVDMGSKESISIVAIVLQGIYERPLVPSQMHYKASPSRPLIVLCHARSRHNAGMVDLVRSKL